MLDYLRIFISVIFLLGAAYLFVMSIVATYRNFEFGKMTRQAAKVRLVYLCSSAICGFLAFEIYHPNIISIPFLFVLLGLFGFEYLMNMLVVTLQKKFTEKQKKDE